MDPAVAAGSSDYGGRRVFIAVTPAHLVIPTGGLGCNTGVGDADRSVLEGARRDLAGLGRSGPAAVLRGGAAAIGAQCVGLRPGQPRPHGVARHLPPGTSRTTRRKAVPRSHLPAIGIGRGGAKSARVIGASSAIAMRVHRSSSTSRADRSRTSTSYQRPPGRACGCRMFGCSPGVSVRTASPTATRCCGSANEARCLRLAKAFARGRRAVTAPSTSTARRAAAGVRLRLSPGAARPSCGRGAAMPCRASRRACAHCDRALASL